MAGRQAIPVQPTDLQAAVNQCEANGPLRSRSELWQAVSDTPWAVKLGLQPQVAMLRAKQFGTVIATPKGQRGRAPGQGMPKGCVPPAKQEGVQRNINRRLPLNLIDDFKGRFPESMHSAIKRAASGSMKAAIKLFCFECVQSKAEIARCTDTACALHGFRPYKREHIRIGTD